MSQLDEKTSNSAATGGEGAVQAASNAAAHVADVASERGKGLAGEAATEIREIGSEVAHQAQNVLGDALNNVRSRAESEVAGSASALRRLADQGQALVDGRPSEAGPLLQYAERGVGRLRQLAGTLETRGADGVVGDVQAFARRRPGAFLAIAGVGGFVVGRMLRSGVLSASPPEPARAGSGGPEAAIAPYHPGEPEPVVGPGSAGLGVDPPEASFAPFGSETGTFDSGQPAFSVATERVTDTFDSWEPDFSVAPEPVTEPFEPLSATVVTPGPGSEPRMATDSDNPWPGIDGEVPGDERQL